MLFDQLRCCKECLLGPLLLARDTVVGETMHGLGGYLHVKCMNPDCCSINKVAYGKTYRKHKKGMAGFVVNTKLGAGEILFSFDE